MKAVGRTGWRRWIGAAVVVLSGTASAAGPARLEITPAKLELCELARGVPVVVSLENTSKAALDGVELHTAAAARVRVEGKDGCKLAAVPEGATVACDAVVTCAAPPCVTGPVALRATYRKDNAELVAATASLEVVPASIAMSSIATLTAKSSHAEIQENTPGLAYIYLTNLSPYTLTAQLTFHDGGSAKARAIVALIQPPRSVTLAPFAAQTLPFELTMTALGKDTIAVDAAVTWDDGRCPRSGALAASFDLETGSSELSMLLKVLGLPALLLLPGALLLSASAILWRLGLALQARRDPKSEFWFAYASPHFWVLAICISFVWYRLYAWLDTDLRETYRLGDLITLWSYALLIGAALHLVTYGVIRWVVARRDRRAAAQAAALAARTPAPGDDPWTTLHKLALRGQALNLPRVQLGAPPTTAFVLAEDHDQLWICPGITYAAPGDREAAARIVAQRNAGDVAGLAATFKSRPGDLQYAPPGGPRLVKRDTTQPDTPYAILRVSAG
jgi:hypothetical protein